MSCWTIVPLRANACPHNYIVGMPWLKETREAVESMLSFFAEHMAPRMSLNASE